MIDREIPIMEWALEQHVTHGATHEPEPYVLLSSQVAHDTPGPFRQSNRFHRRSSGPSIVEQ
jgi:hypothetical protein